MYNLVTPEYKLKVVAVGRKEKDEKQDEIEEDNESEN